MESIIVRHAPISDKIVVVLANSKRNGQVDIVTDGTLRTVGIDYYQATEPVNPLDAKRVAQEFARSKGIPEDEVILRQRFPKQVVQHNRRTNDANLTLVASDKNGEKQTLAKAAQNLHDSETKGKSTPDNPEGATVKPQDAAPKQRRKYTKADPKAVSKRSQAAMKQYLKEIGQVVDKQPEIMEPPSPTATSEQVDKSVMELAMALAKILKANPEIL